MIASCGVLGLDWERVSLPAFLEAIEAHNDAQDGGKKDIEPASPEFRERMKRMFANGG